MRKPLLASALALSLCTQLVYAHDPVRPRARDGAAAAEAAKDAAKANLPKARATFVLRGEDSRRGPFTSSVTVDQNTGIGLIEVVRVVRFASDREGHLQRGMGRVQGGSIRLTLRDLLGAAGHLSGRASAPTRLTITLQPDGRVKTVARSAAGDGAAEGRRRGSTRTVSAWTPGSERSPATSPAAAPEPSVGGSSRGIVQRGRHLASVALDELKAYARSTGEGLAYDGVSLEERFELSRYLHVGVGGKVNALEPTSLSPEQAYTSRRRPNHVWIVSRIHGGARVSLGTTIPVGSVNVGVGLMPGARLDYEVTDIYPIPEGVSREGLKTLVSDLARVAKRSFDLPLDASEAQAMNVGAKRVFDGQASVAISGSLSVGYDVADLGGVVRIGASARVGGFYRISGDLRVTVERLMADRVRVRVRRGEARARGVAADALVGATLDEGWLREEIRPGVEYIDEALVDTANLSPQVRAAIVAGVEGALVNEAAGRVRKVLRFQVNASASKTVRDEVDVSYACDLTRQQARDGYDRALRGDFTRLARLAIEPGSGVEQEFRVLEVEETTHIGAALELSVLLSASASRDITLKDLSVEDKAGKSNYEVFRFNRKRRFDLGSIKRSKELTAEVIRRERGGVVERSLRITLDVLDPFTFKFEGRRIQRLLASWGLDTTSSLPTPEFELLRTRYGKTRLRIRVVVSEVGLRSILAASDARVFQAYVDGFTALEGKAPLWATPRGRSTIAYAESDDHDRYDRERRQLETAQGFVRSVQRMRRAHSNQARADALSRLAKSTRFDHYVLAALLNLAPRDAVDVDASYLGERIVVVDARETGLASVPVEDPR